MPREAAVRVVGPSGERTPVLNTDGMPLQLKAIMVADPTVAVTASGWRSDSTDVAVVNERGIVRPVGTGFATVAAQTSQGEAKCFVAVMKVTPQAGGMVTGDTKSDSSGTLYLSDPNHHVLVRAAGLETGRWVGATDNPGFADGQGTQARFDGPTGLAVDLSPQGGLYVADTLNHCIRKVGFDGRAGSQQHSSVVVGQAGAEGTMTGEGPYPLAEVRLSGPQGIVSAGGNLYIADTGNDCLWYADVARGQVYLLAGKPGEAGLVDESGSAARFSSPSGLAINTRGTLLAVADTGNNVVRLVRLRAASGGGVVGQVSTLGVASSGKWADAEKAAALDDPADAIPFTAPRSVSTDGVENIYVIDAQGATVVTRPEEQMPQVVALAEPGTLGVPLSLTIRGPQVFVLDGAAASEREAVKSVTVGPPAITSLSPEVDRLEGGADVTIIGRNFAPETAVTLGGSEVKEILDITATRIVFRVPAQERPGGRTLTVATRGGVDQKRFTIQPKTLEELSVGEITTVVGGVPYIGDGGVASSPRVGLSAFSVTIDAAGNLYIADGGNHRIRRVNAATGTIITVAGSGDYGFNGDDRPATTTRLNYPYSTALDAVGNLYIADTYNNRIRRVDAYTGLITTVAGSDKEGFGGDGGPATNALLTNPNGVALDAAGNLFIADSGNNRIRRVDTVTGKISTYAGTGKEGFRGDGRPAKRARLSYPVSIALDAAGDLFIADTSNSAVRRVDASTGVITTAAGTGEQGLGGDGGPASQALLASPYGIALDAAGDLFIADTLNHLVRRVDASTGLITTAAGSGEAGFSGDGGPATDASLQQPTGVVLDAVGNLFIADRNNNRIRRVDAITAEISTVAGSGEVSPRGDDGPAVSAALAFPLGLALDAAGNLFVVDTQNHRIRRVDAVTGVIVTVAGTGIPDYTGDGGPALDATLNYPAGIALDPAGKLYIADAANNVVRQVDLSTGAISTVAGSGANGGSGDGGPATDAAMNSPSDVALDRSGNLYIGDTGNARVRRVDATTGVITTVAGSDTSGFGGDGGPATLARLSSPTGVALDQAGNVYIADRDNARVRRVDATTGVITTVAGSRKSGFGGDDGPAASARLSTPSQVALDAAGNLFIADFGNHRIRGVDASTGIITTVAGSGNGGYSGDGGPAKDADLRYPSDVILDAAGNLFVADRNNSAIRAVKGVGARPTQSVRSRTRPPV